MLAAVYYARILVAALGLLILATSVSAECAWVLWEKVTSYRPDEGGPGSGTATLTPSYGFVSAATCEGASRGASNAIVKFLEDGTHDARVRSFKRFEPSSTILVQYENGARRVMDWLCFPDTVDPRGPKGK